MANGWNGTSSPREAEVLGLYWSSGKGILRGPHCVTGLSAPRLMRRGSVIRSHSHVVGVYANYVDYHLKSRSRQVVYS